MTEWPEFYFARHGETDWNRERRYQGRRDIPLNALGREQADANGQLLLDLLKHSDTDLSDVTWYASPLSRASETMDRMRAAFDVPLKPVVYDDRLQEISFGVLEGRLHHEVNEIDAVAPGERDAAYWRYTPPEGENYESVAARVLDFSTRLEGLPVIVAHGGILRVLRHLVVGADYEDVLNWPPPQGVVAHFHHGQMDLHQAMYGRLGL